MSWCCSSHNHLLVGQLFLAAIQGRFGSGCVFRQIQRLPSSLEVLPPTNPPPTSYTSSRNRTGHQAFYWPIKLSGGVWLVETEGRRLLDGRGEGGAAVRDLWEREAEGGLFTVPLTIDTRWLMRSIINQLMNLEFSVYQNHCGLGLWII